MPTRPVILLGAAVLALVTGCAAVGPSATPGASDVVAVAPASAGRTPSVQDSPPAVPTGRLTGAKLRRVDTVELDAEWLALRAGDQTLAVLSMRDRRGTTAALQRLLGSAESTQTAEGDGGPCLPASTTSTWGGALRVAALARPADLGNEVEIRVLRSAVRSRTGDTIELTGPDDVRVGDDVGARIRKADADLRDDVGTRTDPAWQLLLGHGWPSDADGANGVSALTDGTVVTVLGSPMPVHATRSC